MARKRTKKEAKKRIKQLPDIPLPLPVRKTPGGRAIRAIDFASRELGKVLVDLDPLDRLADESPNIQESPPLPPRRFGGGGSDKPFDGLQRSVETRRRLAQEAQQMNTEEAIMQIVNDPMVVLDDRMVDVINRPDIVFDEFGVLRQIGIDAAAPTITKKKRRRSKYQIELGKQLKRLKKKHPRTPVTRLMKRAHRATKKALKM